jgi:inner membrane protein
MDNLTHSFAGALLAQMGLKKLSGRATATLVIAANIPDIDAFASFLGTESLAIRRGLTHGPIALALLPLILTAVVMAWNRWRPADQPVRFWPLLLCAYIGTLSHPALDWLNSYGVRLLEPFSSTWYAGDTLFIIDVWVWAALIGCWVWSRRREKRGGDWQRPAWIGFAAIGAYIFANGLITAQAEHVGAHSVNALVTAGDNAPLTGRTWSLETPLRRSEPNNFITPELVVANPQPVLFWRRQLLWRGAGLHGSLSFDAVRDLKAATFTSNAEPIRLDHPVLAAARGRKDVDAFLFWSRMPIVIERGGVTYLADQRFNSELTRGQFLVPLSSKP